MFLRGKHGFNCSLDGWCPSAKKIGGLDGLVDMIMFDDYIIKTEHCNHLVEKTMFTSIFLECLNELDIKFLDRDVRMIRLINELDV